MFKTRIPLYGIFIIISIISGLFVIFFNIKKLKYKKEEIIGLFIYIILGALLGGKYFTFFTNYKIYNGEFNFFKVGLSSYGGLIGSILVVFLFSKQ